MPPRIIHLRRPPVLQVQAEPFVPDRSSMVEIEERWESLRTENPAYFDGRICHVLGVHRNGCGGAVLHVADCAYRFHAVQDGSFDLGVRPLGVKGLTRREGQYLLGKRSRRVAHYQQMWEFAPGGVVEPGSDPGSVIARELYEETGLQPVAEPVAVALIYDEVLRCWELVFALDAADHCDEPPTSEYSELRWCGCEELPEPLSPPAQQMRRWLST